MNTFKWSDSVLPKFLLSIVMVLILLQVGISNSFAGESMKKAQQSLIEKGLNPGPVDGFWGPKTEKALMEYQKREGLAVNGKLDAATKYRLFAGEATSPWKAKPFGSWTPFDVDSSEIADDPAMGKSMPMLPPKPRKGIKMKKAMKLPPVESIKVVEAKKVEPPAPPEPTMAKPEKKPLPRRLK